mmetsp:Transcript_22691/g.47802  ORF Transcript_22691/g.47802 Transcript_22691/m.47802 type:complete len:640 (+) Transcript_22691:204-2123(+)
MNTKLKMKTSNSYHGGAASTELKPISTVTKRRMPSSFHSVTDRSQDVQQSKYCAVHPEISLVGGAEGCPKCAIRLMQVAVKQLERRAAEMEVEGKEKEIPGSKIKKSPRDSSGASSNRRAKTPQRQEGRMVASMTSMKVAKNPKEETRLRRSTGSASLVCGSSPMRRSSTAKNSKPLSENKRSARPPLKRQLSIGQIAQPHQIDEPSGQADVLIKIARLREGDGAWVKRTGDVWTYAILKSRKNGQDASLTFTVNSRGSKKKFCVTQWAKFVRLVAEDDDVDAELEREEEEIDIIVSDGQLSESSPIDEFLTTKEGRQDVPGLVKSMESLASEPFTPGSDDTMSKDSSSSQESDEGRGIPERRRNLSKNLSMYTLASLISPPSHDSICSTDSSSSKKERKDHEGAEVLKVEEGSMYALACIDAPDTNDPAPKKISSSSKSNEDHRGAIVLRDDKATNTLALRENSPPPILKYEPTPEEDKQHGRRVSFDLPEEDEGRTSVRSSMSSESSPVDYDADGEGVSVRGAPRGAGKVRKPIHRSSSMPEDTKHTIPKQKRRPPRRASWSEDADQIKEEIKSHNLKRPETKKEHKKRLSELDMGQTIPKNHGQIHHESFYSALKSIHRRSSVMMPPTSSVAVNLN